MSKPELIKTFYDDALSETQKKFLGFVAARSQVLKEEGDFRFSLNDTATHRQKEYTGTEVVAGDLLVDTLNFSHTLRLVEGEWITTNVSVGCEGGYSNGLIFNLSFEPSDDDLDQADEHAPYLAGLGEDDPFWQDDDFVEDWMLRISKNEDSGRIGVSSASY
jgi:hypothetical protein